MTTNIRLQCQEQPPPPRREKNPSLRIVPSSPNRLESRNLRAKSVADAVQLSFGQRFHPTQTTGRDSLGEALRHADILSAGLTPGSGAEGRLFCLFVAQGMIISDIRSRHLPRFASEFHGESSTADHPRISSHSAIEVSYVKSVTALILRRSSIRKIEKM